MTAEQTTAMRRAGLALAAIGLLDIGYCILAVARGESYSSSLNVFALVAGILVYRGSESAARFCIKGLSFLLGVFLLLAFVIPFLMPLRLLWVQVKLSPFESVRGLLVVCAFCGVLYWIRRALASLPVYPGGAFAPHLYRSPAAWAGAAIPILSAFLVAVFLNGTSGTRAIEEARRKVGPGYSFHVRRLTTAGRHGSAIVTAYSGQEVRQVAVEWNDEQDLEEADSPKTR